jgi:hypothetical protein
MRAIAIEAGEVLLEYEPTPCQTSSDRTSADLPWMTPEPRSPLLFIAGAARSWLFRADADGSIERSNAAAVAEH